MRRKWPKPCVEDNSRVELCWSSVMQLAKGSFRPLLALLTQSGQVQPSHGSIFQDTESGMMVLSAWSHPMQSAKKTTFVSTQSLRVYGSSWLTDVCIWSLWTAAESRQRMSQQLVPAFAPVHHWQTRKKWKSSGGSTATCHSLPGVMRSIFFTLARSYALFSTEKTQSAQTRSPGRWQDFCRKKTAL